MTHGIFGGYYTNHPAYDKPDAILECLCGWTSNRSDNWQEAGEQLDEHLQIEAHIDKREGRN